MTPAPSQIYPGTMASPVELRLLAEEYRVAAHALRQLGRPGEPWSRAPFRLLAIHAIELYLNALLLHRGREPRQVRSLQHDMAKRAELARGAGLRLRSKTAGHLAALGHNREYLVTRYEPEPQGASELNRLVATLDEVAIKVTAELEPSPLRTRPVSSGPAASAALRG
jgi:hypothetical protein